MNLVESLQGQFSTELCKKLGGLVGANESDMRKLMDAGLPCILASLALIASKPSGAQTIAKALDSLGPNAFGSTEKILESGAMNSGGSLLNNILGNNLVDQITTTVSTYTRVNPSTVRIGLGYFMPLILGTVGAETAGAAAQPCNATSIANLFAPIVEVSYPLSPTNFRLLRSQISNPSSRKRLMEIKDCPLILPTFSDLHWFH
jgi:hypothetical protein